MPAELIEKVRTPRSTLGIARPANPNIPAVQLLGGQMSF
jgi:hypothetical protein